MTQLTDQVTFKHGATLANRMVQPPMLTNSGLNGQVTTDTLNYWQARSNSAAMMITEYCYVSPAGGPATTWADDRTQLAIYDDKFVPGLRQMAQAMKAHGHKAVIQLAHTGREANYRAHLGLPVYAPTTANYSFLPYGVKAFTGAQVEQVVKDFGTAAKRAIDAGFDGIEIHGANHYLHQQFFSRFSNQRTDKWGQPEAFPMAVAQEIFRVVQQYAPKDFILGYRISPEELNDGTHIGYTWHEATKLVADLTATFDFDYIHLSLPLYRAHPNDSDKTYAALFRPYLGQDTKLIIVGNVMDQSAAEDALQYTDLVAAGRAQLIDANFAAKVIAGRNQDIITDMSPEEERAQKLTPGLQEAFNRETKRPDWGNTVLKDLDYSKALKVSE